MAGMGCRVKVSQYRKLGFRVIWPAASLFGKLRSWEGTKHDDTPKNTKIKELMEAQARLISDEMKRGVFDYLKWFPNGNKAYLFRAQQSSEPAQTYTVEGYYKRWVQKQAGRVRPHRIKDYKSHFQAHILPAKVAESEFGKIPLPFLNRQHLKDLQDNLSAKGLKASSVNGIAHSSLRAMLRDARVEGVVNVDLFDKVLFRPLPMTDVETSTDPYTPEEREDILEGFKTHRPHYFSFVYFQFWQGTRPSEATALRRKVIDLRYASVKIQRSRVEGKEAGTKTKRSNREIHLHDNVVEMLEALLPLHVKPEDYVFTTLQGYPIDEHNFFNREWLPMLRRLRIRPRPFYNSRHSYTSFMLSIGARTAFVSDQTGDSIKTLESCYAKYIPSADSGRDILEAEINESEIKVKYRAKRGQQARARQAEKRGKPLSYQGLKDGAGDRGRTDDLMLGKHTL